MELLLLAIVNLLFPPAAVAIKAGFDIEFVISLVLTLFGYFPGLLYGFYIILRSE